MAPDLQPAEFVASLKKPRAVIMLVQAGKPVDDTIATLSAFMEVRGARVRLQTPAPFLACSSLHASPVRCCHACMHLQPGDLLIDGGNEWYPNTTRRGAELAPRGLLYMGMGVSGGEEGAR